MCDLMGHYWSRFPELRVKPSWIDWREGQSNQVVWSKNQRSMSDHSTEKILDVMSYAVYWSWPSYWISSDCFCIIAKYKDMCLPYIFAYGGGLDRNLACVEESSNSIVLTHLKLFFISRSFAITSTGSVFPVAFWIMGSLFKSAFVTLVRWLKLTSTLINTLWS